jgi:hypothetical protein
MVMNRSIAIAALIAWALGCGTTPSGTEPVTWDPAFFPLEEGSIWVYEETVRRGPRVEQQLRVKTAILHRDGVYALQDAEGDDYLFSSTPQGLCLHGELKPSGKEVSFQPPLEYVSQELLREKERSASHRADGRTIQARAWLVGMRRVTSPATGKVDALVTGYEYRTEDGKRFAIENSFVRGLGPALRSFRLETKEGQVLFSTELKLVAAFVQGRAYPKDSPDRLAELTFRDAYQHRDVWDDAFPGFTATLVYYVGSRKVGDFPLKVGKSGASVSIEGLKEEDEDSLWLMRTAKSMAEHRRGKSFEERHANVRFKLLESKGAILAIELVGDAMGSRYEVSGGAVRSVSRLDERGRRFRVETKAVTWTSVATYLPTAFRITYFDAELRPTEEVDVKDEFTEVDSYRIPSRREVRSGDVVREVRIENIRLN